MQDDIARKVLNREASIHLSQEEAYNMLQASMHVCSCLMTYSHELLLLHWVIQGFEEVSKLAHLDRSYMQQGS